MAPIRPLVPLLLAASAIHARGLTLQMVANQDPSRPVSKVISVLKDMLKTLDKEQKQDEDVYAKMACWCDSGEKEKTVSIADAEDTIVNLNSAIEAGDAESQRLESQMRTLERQVADSKQALNESALLREEQHQTFVAEELELTEAIQSVKSALVVLSKHNGAFLQESVSTKMAVQKVQRAFQRFQWLVTATLSPSQRQMARSLAQLHGGFAEKYDPVHPKPQYTEQSGEIFGILQAMLEAFEASLADAQKKEAAAQTAFLDLAETKNKEIKLVEEDHSSKSLQNADAKKKKAEDSESLQDTQDALVADQEYLAMLKAKCEATSSEWDERQATRQDEIAAVSKALDVLSADDAHDLFTRTFAAASFLQKSASANSELRANASSLLSRVASKVGNPRLAVVATQLKLDNFTEVKASIDNMIAELTTESNDEIKHKDFCIVEFNENELQTDEKEHEKERVLAEIATLETTIEVLAKEIDELNTTNRDMEYQLKQAAENRELENTEFQSTVADQRETQSVLEQAKAFLLSYYGQRTNPAAYFMQKQAEPVGPPPPAGFDKYENSASSNRVIGLIEQIITDAKQMEKDTTRAEEDAQKAYEDFVKGTNGSIQANSVSIVDKSEDQAGAEERLLDAKTDRDNLHSDLEQLATYKGEVHASCDFILKNFEVRQAARNQEIEALRQAKAILSGSNFGR